MAKTPRWQIPGLVDNLGLVKAQAANLARIEQRLKKQLGALGAGAYEGRLFQATVVKKERACLDLVAVRKKLPDAWLARYTEFKKVTEVRVVARKKKP